MARFFPSNIPTIGRPDRFLRDCSDDGRKPCACVAAGAFAVGKSNRAGARARRALRDVSCAAPPSSLRQGRRSARGSYLLPGRIACDVRVLFARVARQAANLPSRRNGVWRGVLVLRPRQGPDGCNVSIAAMSAVDLARDGTHCCRQRKKISYFCKKIVVRM